MLRHRLMWGANERQAAANTPYSVALSTDSRRKNLPQKQAVKGQRLPFSDGFGEVGPTALYARDRIYMKETTMNKNSRRLGIYLIISFMLTVTAIALRTAALFRELTPYGYFDDKTLITVAGAIFWGGMVLYASFGAVGHKVNLRPSFSSPATYVPTGLTSVALVFFAIRMIGEADIVRRSSAVTAGGSRTVLLVMAILCAVFALLSVAHFFLNAFLTEGKTELRSYFAVATVMTLACYAAYLYFAQGEAMNSPNRITDQMAFLFSALFFLYEARISLGREKWRAYCVFGMMAASACLYSAVPSMILYLATGQAVFAGLEQAILTLCVGFFILMRLILTVNLPEAEENKRLAAISNAAAERAKRVSDVELRYDEEYAVQLTIDELIPTEDESGAVTDADDEDTDDVFADEFVLPTVEPETVFITDDEPEDDGQIELVSELFNIDTPDEEANEDGDTEGDAGAE